MPKPVSDPLIIERPELYGGDPGRVLVEYLEWYRRTLLRNCSGLTDEQLAAPVEPLGWSMLGLIQHLGWVERRWLQWGFAGRPVEPYPVGVGASDHSAEFVIPAGDSTATVIARYHQELDASREIVDGEVLGRRARTGGRFSTAAQAPALGDILFHLLQEYARHVGQLDVARELTDGATGE